MNEEDDISNFLGGKKRESSIVKFEHNGYAVEVIQLSSDESSVEYRDRYPNYNSGQMSINNPGWDVLFWIRIYKSGDLSKPIKTYEINYGESSHRWFLCPYRDIKNQLVSKGGKPDSSKVVETVKTVFVNFQL